jgi:hypothetical protein
VITGPRRVKTAFPKSGHTDDVLFSKPGYNCKGKREGQLSNDDIPIKGVSEKIMLIHIFTSFPV